MNNNIPKKTVFYGQIPGELLTNPKISSHAKTLYGVLHFYCDFAHKDLRYNPKICLSQRILSKAIGLTRVMVWKYLNELEDSGWILIDGPRGGQRPNNYVLLGRQLEKRGRTKKATKRTDRGRDYLNWKNKKEAEDGDVKGA